MLGNQGVTIKVFFRWLIPFSIFFVFIVLLIILVFSVLVFKGFHNIGNNDLIKPENSNQFHYLEINPFQNSTVSRGFITVPETNDFAGGYETHISEESDFVLIHSFGEENDEYKCFGSCYCDEGNPRRVAQVLVRGVSIILVAIGMQFAMQKASEEYNKLCHSRFHDSCSSGKVVSDIDDCKKKEKETLRTYLCKGYCVRNPAIRADAAIEKQKSMKCKKFKLKKEITIDTSTIPYRKNLWEYYSEYAAEEFKNSHFSDYCKTISKWKYTFRSKKSGARLDDRSRTISLCTSENNLKLSFERSESNVNCVEM